MKKKFYEWAKQTFFLVLGSALCAFAVKAILIPQEFISTGLTGAALVLYYKYPVVSVEALYLIINIPVFLLGWRFVGIRFVLYSVWGMIIYSMILFFIDVQINIADPMLAAVTAGSLSGIGVAIILRSYGSIGGTEIFSVIMHKRFSLSVGTGTAIINGIVLIASALLFPIETVLYAFVYATVNMLILDKIFYGMTGRKAALIISEQWQEIAKDLLGQCNVGITKISGKGGFRGTDKTILYSVINRKNIGAVKKIVLQKDPSAFMTLMTTEDVTGLRIGNQPHW
ncbi:MAG: YitT family protein [Desulfosalsimonadaceae bacterium]|jgi:uncharacterized membrane-anchored protein YitT (DUF2179 family)|nr:MAG: YitT family protein [Desulfobacteraceae bacterium]